MIKNTLSNLLLPISILIVGLIISFAIIGFGVTSVQATSPDDIIYPVKELGGCIDESECREYCDNFDHMNECISFAEKHNLMSDEEAREARHFAKAGIRKGPGGCTTSARCEAYCEDINNIEECLAFAEEHDVISDEELDEARKVAKALREGAELPGGCTSKESCDAYCSDTSHIEECIAFAEKAGFISDEELEEVRRILPLMQSGQMPGGCTSKEQCESYCEDESHFEECIAFAEKAGFISPEEAEMARRTGGKGPGGCRRDECESYCEDISHQDECFAFAKEHGLISEEDLARMKEGAERIREGLERASPEVLSCLRDKVGPNVVEDIKNGTFSMSRQSGENIRMCFEQFMPAPEFPSEVKHCVIEIYGEGAIERIMKGEINHEEIEEGVGPCINKLMREKFEMEEMMMDEHDNEFESGSMPPAPTGPSIELDFPPQAKECLIKLYGADYEHKMISGEIDPSEIKGTIQSCMEENMRLQQFQSSAVLESLKTFLRNTD